MKLHRLSAFSKASLRSGCLALDLPQGPLLLDLRALPHTHFLVRHENGAAQFGYADARGSFTLLAGYASAAEAEAMLSAVRAALFLFPSLLRLALKALVVVAVFFIFLFALNGVLGMLAPSSAPSPAPSAAQHQGADPAAGVPVDADEKLKRMTE